MTDLPRTIQTSELAPGQHVSVRYDYDEVRANVWEGVVASVKPLVLRDWPGTLEDHHQPGYDVVVTLLAEAPKPRYEIDSLADVIFNEGTNYGIRASKPMRCWWNGGEWVAIGTGFRNCALAIEPKDVISVTPLRIAGPEDIIIPVSEAAVTLGGETWHVHRVVDSLTGGLGGDFANGLATLFCSEISHSGQCCQKHATHANPHVKCIMR